VRLAEDGAGPCVQLDEASGGARHGEGVRRDAAVRGDGGRRRQGHAGREAADQPRAAILGRGARPARAVGGPEPCPPQAHLGVERGRVGARPLPGARPRGGEDVALRTGRRAAGTPPATDTPDTRAVAASTADGGAMNLEPGGLIAWLIVGAVAGWLAGQFMRGGGYGLVGDIVVGIIGAFVGGFLLSVLGIGGSAGLVGSIVVAFIGAVVLVALLRMLSPARAP
jgi:uncharacterized membrane protein YeaQ/YmgE (transglycosylase-associated protein family)